MLYLLSRGDLEVFLSIYRFKCALVRVMVSFLQLRGRKAMTQSHSHFAASSRSENTSLCFNFCMNNAVSCKMSSLTCVRYLIVCKLKNNIVSNTAPYQEILMSSSCFQSRLIDRRWRSSGNAGKKNYFKKGVTAMLSELKRDFYFDT